MPGVTLDQGPHTLNSQSQYIGGKKTSDLVSILFSQARREKTVAGIIAF
jgi:hypothetical protein